MTHQRQEGQLESASTLCNDFEQMDDKAVIKRMVTYQMWLMSKSYYGIRLNRRTKIEDGFYALQPSPSDIRSDHRSQSQIQFRIMRIF